MDTGGYRAYASEDVVTGEGVAVELPVASTVARSVSGLIDVVVQFVLLIVIGFTSSWVTGRSSEAVATSVGLVSALAVLVGLPTAVETLSRGRSLGKLAMGLRTVRDDGGPITSRHALTRALVGVVEIWTMLGIPAVVTSMLNSRCKRLGDLAAGTYVVSQRSRMRLLAPPQMPPPLAAWAATADIAALPDGLSVAVRQFLARSASLTPASRDALGADLYREVTRLVAPAPPPGIHPEYVLAAVVAERRTRDEQRLARHQQLRDRLVAPDPLLPPAHRPWG